MTDEEFINHLKREFWRGVGMGAQLGLALGLPILVIFLIFYEAS